MNKPLKNISEDQIILEGWQNIIIEKLFNDEIKPCAITIQSKGRKNAYAWCSTDERWQNGKPESAVQEINFSAEHLNRPIKDMFETMIHELVHAWNSQHGIRDFSGQRHNKKFKTKCEKVGLKVEKMGKYGWADTTIEGGGIADNLFKTLEIDKTVFNYARLETNKKKAPTKMKKWSCGCTNVRCAVIFEAYCEKCGSSFGLED